MWMKVFLLISQFGFCGSGEPFCGVGCKEGPCYPLPTSGISVADLVTEDFFTAILNKAAGDCPGRGFYTRQAFLDALSSYPEFGSSNSANETKREIAAFFAHTTHESGYFCSKELPGNNGERQVYCNSSYIEYPCNPSKKYYGRGPLQLTWNFNYGPAGSSNSFEGLNSPETVATDAVLSFKTALWFWRENVRSVLSQGFGATINVINGPVECGGRETDKVEARIDLYKDYCNQFGVAAGDNLSCQYMQQFICTFSIYLIFL